MNCILLNFYFSLIKIILKDMIRSISPCFYVKTIEIQQSIWQTVAILDSEKIFLFLRRHWYSSIRTRCVDFTHGVTHIKLWLPVLLCAVKTVEGDFRFCWTITPNVGQTHKENPNLVRILYMVCTLNDIYKQYNKLHEH